MKKPEKYKHAHDCCPVEEEYASNYGYNKCIDDYEAFLPSEEEILSILDELPDTNNYEVNKFEAAKKIHKRLRGE